MTETAERKQAHRRGVTVTTVACLTGIAAGVASQAIATGPGDRTGQLLVLAAFVLDLGIIAALGVDVGDFSAKDYLYTAFMSFALWFVTWGILLTSNTPV